MKQARNTLQREVCLAPKVSKVGIKKGLGISDIKKTEAIAWRSKKFRIIRTLAFL
jgi:hypothetical protein